MLTPYVFAESAGKFWNILEGSPVDSKTLFVKDHEILLLVFMASLTDLLPLFPQLDTPYPHLHPQSLPLKTQEANRHRRLRTGGYSLLSKRWRADTMSQYQAGLSG